MPLLIFRPDVIPLWIGIGISIYLLIAGSKFKHTKIGLDFMILMFLAVIWQVIYSINISTSMLWLVHILVSIEISCMAAIPVLILVFAGRLTQRAWVSRPRVIAAFSIVPLITAILTSTNNIHHLVYTGFSLKIIRSGYLITPDFANWYVVHGVYAYMLILIALIFLFDWLQKATPASRGQATVLLLGILPPVFLNVSFTTGFIATSIDPTPLAFSVSGLILLWGLYRYGLLDMVPIAREMIVESIHDGVIVLDNADTVMEINPPAARFLESSRSALIGSRMPDLYARMGETLSVTKDDEGEVVTIESQEDGKIVEYEMRSSPINDKGGLVQGRVILLRNVTAQRRLERELRELSSTDHLTGLMNRRTFFLELTKHIRLAHRYRYQLTVCMMDLDRFKELNDRYGHQVGDEALALASRVIQKTVRSSDVAARYGGDELVLMLIHTGEKGALSLCRRIVEAVGNVQVQNGFQLGVSIGVTCLTREDGDDGESLIARADDALYQAKERGRGGIVVG